MAVQDAMDSLDRSVAAAFSDEQPVAKQTGSTSKKVCASLDLLPTGFGEARHDGTAHEGRRMVVKGPPALA